MEVGIIKQELKEITSSDMISIRDFLHKEIKRAVEKPYFARLIAAPKGSCTLSKR